MSVDLKQAGSTGSNGRIKAMVEKLKNKKTTTYDGGNEVDGYHNQAEKTSVKTKNKGKYTKHGKGKESSVTKKTQVNDDTPYSGRKNEYGDVKGGKQTLTKTKTVKKNNKEVTKVKEKAISNKRAERIKKSIRKKDPSNKTKAAADAEHKAKYGS